jgi:hypothetical protein
MEALKEIAQHVTLNLASGHQIWTGVRVTYSGTGYPVEICGIYAQNEYGNEVNVMLDVPLSDIQRIQSKIFFMKQHKERDWDSGIPLEDSRIDDQIALFESIPDPYIENKW